MNCKKCEKALSSELLSRPVHFCKHIICFSCAGSLSCQICGVVAEGSPEDHIDSEILKFIADMNDVRKSFSIVQRPHFSCPKHTDEKISFICKKEMTYLCSKCVWTHILDHKDSLIPYDNENFTADCAQLKSAFDNIHNKFLDTEKVFNGIKNLKPGKSEFTRAFESARSIVSKFDESAINILHPIFDEESQTRRLDLGSILGVPGIVAENPVYKATRDGQDIDTFRELCAEEGPTLLLIYANSHRFGAYLHNSWCEDDGDTAGDPNNFIFFLSDPPIKLNWTGKDDVRGQDNGYGYTFISVGDCEIVILNDFIERARSFVEPGVNYGKDQPQCLHHFKKLNDRFKVEELEVYLVSPAVKSEKSEL